MASPRLLWADTFQGSGRQVEQGPGITSYSSSTLCIHVAMHKKEGTQGVSSEDAAICDMAPVRSRRLKLARYTSIQYRYLALVRCGPILLTCLHTHTCRRC